MINFDSDGIDDYNELVDALDRFELSFKTKWLQLDMKSRDIPSEKLCVDDPPKHQLMVLPSYLWYIYFRKNSILPVIIIVDLSEGQTSLGISIEAM